MQECRSWSSKLSSRTGGLRPSPRIFLMLGFRSLQNLVIYLNICTYHTHYNTASLVVFPSLQIHTPHLITLPSPNTLMPLPRSLPKNLRLATMWAHSLKQTWSHSLALSKPPRFLLCPNRENRVNSTSSKTYHTKQILLHNTSNPLIHTSTLTSTLVHMVHSLLFHYWSGDSLLALKEQCEMSQKLIEPFPSILPNTQASWSAREKMSSQSTLASVSGARQQQGHMVDLWMQVWMFCAVKELARFQSGSMITVSFEFSSSI